MKIPLYMIWPAPAHPTWLSPLEAAATCRLQSTHTSLESATPSAVVTTLARCLLETVLMIQWEPVRSHWQSRPTPTCPILTVAPQHVTADIRDRNLRPAPMPNPPTALGFPPSSSILPLSEHNGGERRCHTSSLPTLPHSAALSVANKPQRGKWEGWRWERSHLFAASTFQCWRVNRGRQRGCLLTCWNVPGWVDGRRSNTPLNCKPDWSEVTALPASH